MILRKKKKKKPTEKTSDKKREQIAEAEMPEAGKPGKEVQEPAVEAGPAAENDQQQEVVEAEILSEKLAALEDQLLRLRAEYANYKRRSEKERAEIAALVKANLFRGIIPVIDDFERFFQHVADSRNSLDEDFVKGIEMIHNSLVGYLKKQGVEVIDTTGVPFDPQFHEAMLTEPVEKQSDDHAVLQVLEVGYRLCELVIRPAKVKVGIYNKK